MERLISRADFNKRLLTVLGALPFYSRTGPLSFVIPPIDLPTSPVENTKVFERWGLVDVSSNGGPINHDVSIQDAHRLGAKVILSIDPDQRYLGKLVSEGFNVINRPYFENNIYEGNTLNRSLEKYNSLPKSVHMIIELFKEPNSPSQNGGSFLEPEDFISNRFIPAARGVIGRGGVALLSALDQRAHLTTGVDEEDYFSAMLKEVKRYTPELIPLEKLGIAMHAYFFAPGENPWPRVEAFNELVRQILGQRMPIFITEAGLYQNSQMNYTSQTVGRETIRILDSFIPQNVDIKAFCHWILANKAQRPEDINDREEDDLIKDLIEGFEFAALRKVHGESEAYRLIEKHALGAA